ncbi:hypothetical protein M0R72_07355 [Candidatus Pacearchaeota archaeon]|nr:hypothetical protein [Candidatus Pacearchaeota archaeon]
MQIAKRVHQGWAKNARSIDLKTEKLRFKPANQKPTADSRRAATAISKAVWAMRLSAAREAMRKQKEAEARRSKRGK